jgi:hypothetical protein
MVLSVKSELAIDHIASEPAPAILRKSGCHRLKDPFFPTESTYKVLRTRLFLPEP